MQYKQSAASLRNSTNSIYNEQNCSTCDRTYKSHSVYEKLKRDTWSSLLEILMEVTDCTKIYTYNSHSWLILTAVPFIRIVSGTVLTSVTPQPPVNAGSIVTLPFIRLAHCRKQTASRQCHAIHSVPHTAKYPSDLSLMQYTASFSTTKSAALHILLWKIIKQFHIR